MLDEIGPQLFFQYFVIVDAMIVMRFVGIFFCWLENHTATVLWEIRCHLVTSQSDLEVDNHITVNLTKN